MVTANGVGVVPLVGTESQGALPATTMVYARVPLVAVTVTLCEAGTFPPSGYVKLRAAAGTFSSGELEINKVTRMSSEEGEPWLTTVALPRYVPGGKFGFTPMVTCAAPLMSVTPTAAPRTIQLLPTGLGSTEDTKFSASPGTLEIVTVCDVMLLVPPT